MLIWLAIEAGGMQRALGCLVVALVLAGCGAPEPMQDAPAEQPGPVEPATLAGMTWAFDECLWLRTRLRHQPEAQPPELPEEYRAGSFPEMDVYTVTCSAAVVGATNASLAPFGFAAIWDFIQTPDYQPDDGPAAYVHELVVTDADAAQRLASFGFPAVVGTVTRAATATAIEGSYASDSSSFSFSGVPVVPATGSAAGLEMYIHHKTDSERHVWFVLHTGGGPSSSTEPGLASFAGGHLETVFGAVAAMPATGTLDAGEIDWTFGEHVDD